MEHYFTSDPTAKSEERIINYKIKDMNIKFVSDNGVFSKNHIDFATDFLIKTIYHEVSGSVLDLGCGYGAIGITIAKKDNVKKVKMIDINHRALNLARRNSESNNVKDKIEIIESDGFSNIDNEEKFDVIITNPPIRAGKATIYKMYEDSKEYLNNGGVLYIVINKKHGAPSTIEFLKNLFGNCEVLDKKSGFNVIKCIKSWYELGRKNEW